MLSLSNCYNHSGISASSPPFGAVSITQPASMFNHLNGIGLMWWCNNYSLLLTTNKSFIGEGSYSIWMGVSESRQTYFQSAFPSQVASTHHIGTNGWSVGTVPPTDYTHKCREVGQKHADCRPNTPLIGAQIAQRK